MAVEFRVAFRTARIHPENCRVLRFHQRPLITELAELLAAGGRFIGGIEHQNHIPSAQFR